MSPVPYFSNDGIAAILLRAFVEVAGRPELGLQVEHVTPETHPWCAYTGAFLTRNDSDGPAARLRKVDLYLCDDDPDAPTWMIDTFDADSGEVNPLPFTADALNEALNWLLEK